MTEIEIRSLLENVLYKEETYDEHWGTCYFIYGEHQGQCFDPSESEAGGVAHLDWSLLLPQSDAEKIKDTHTVRVQFFFVTPEEIQWAWYLNMGPDLQQRNAYMRTVEFDAVEKPNEWTFLFKKAGVIVLSIMHDCCPEIIQRFCPDH